MVSENDVLKAIVECCGEDKITTHKEVLEKLSIDDKSLSHILEALKDRGFIIATLSEISITDLGLSAYNELTPTEKVKKSIYKFSKFTFQRVVDVIIGIIIGVVIAYITQHFGWQ